MECKILHKYIRIKFYYTYDMFNRYLLNEKVKFINLEKSNFAYNDQISSQDNFFYKPIVAVQE